jgi:hypothetical protein
MNNSDNESLVSVDYVIKKLGLQDSPEQIALEKICELVSNDNIDLYFNEPTYGTDCTHEIELQFDDDGTPMGALIGNGYSFHHNDQRLKQSLSLCLSSISPSPSFAVQQYLYDDKKYYVTDNEGTWAQDKHLKPQNVFFNKEQVNSIAKNNSNKIDSVTKALALIARDIAETKGGKFKSGNKVNAKSFKDHVIELANKYEISDSYLSSLDDKLNKALNALDLKEISKKK